MKNVRPQPTRADAALLRNTVLKLTAASRIFTIAVVIIIALVWWSLLHKVVAFGAGLDYSGLDAFGAQVATLVKQYNPFFWWAVVALCTLIIAYFLYGFVEAMNRRASARRVDADIVARLASRLTPPALQVLQWSWQNRREPITVGVLQRTSRELQMGRAARIQLAERHAAILDASTTADEVEKTLPTM
jgi:hypothetical protein